MVVATDTDEVRQARKSMIELLLGNHPLRTVCLQFAFAAASQTGQSSGWLPSRSSIIDLRAADFVSVSGYDHAIGDGDSAGSLQLGHFLNAHQTHAARSLKESPVVAERGNFNTHGFAGFNKKRASKARNLFAVDGDGLRSLLQP